MPSTPTPLRCAVVAPVPVPYREPLFAGLAAREDLALRVIYQAGAGAGWDQAREWFPDRHGYDAVHLRAAQLPRPGRTPVIWPRGLEAALRAHDPAVVVAWEYGPASLRAFAWSRLHRRAFVIFSENTPWVDERLPEPQLALHRRLAHRADGFIAASSAARRRFLALGADPASVAVSLQSFDGAAIRAEAASGASRGDGSPVQFLTVARLVPDKNLDGLLHALAELPKGAAELRIVGTGPLEGELRSVAQRLGVAAHFAGELARDGLPAAYAAADAFVLPSRFEPFGVVVREAAAAGLPIVCSERAGAAGDVAVAGRNALLVDPGDTAALAAALRSVATDPGLRAALGRESRAIDAEQPIERSVDAFARAITSARAPRAPRRPEPA